MFVILQNNVTVTRLHSLATPGNTSPMTLDRRSILVRGSLLLQAPHVYHLQTSTESADNYVAGNIYINRDLSPIEAKLTYQKQVKRRERLILCQNLRSSTSNTPVN